MATILANGQRTWTLQRDEEGYREYKLKFLVLADYLDGPANVIRTAGLPLPGAPWLVDNDFDPWSWCRPTATVRPLTENEPNRWWEVETTFSNKPVPRDQQRCHDVPVDDPLLEPPKVSGGFTKYTEEAVFNRFGEAILNSAFEQIRGPQNEWDQNRPTVRIEQNVTSFAQAFSLPAQMMDTLNDRILWGLPPRRIKLSSASWEKHYHGRCSTYYKRVLEFDVRYDGWDRNLLDEGTKVLNGRWNETTGAWTLVPVATGQTPNPGNPAHFMRAVDRAGNPIHMVLDGHGLPAEALVGTGTGTFFTGIGEIHVEKYGESNFLLLGIPLTF